ncbi:MAG: RdgB/HAM1 family non-canonical purine NTP pyrophosphatase [Lentisphaeria bacterium]|nr:RdgB/HAM1 family non-canonical purine NTP pyrophosphatase [Lentisphaeria bacterium]
MTQIVVATANAHKVEEYKKLIGDQQVELLSLLDYPGCPEIIENGSSFEENASLKAVAASKYCGIPVFADDSGLEIEALNGAPGIFSARYAETNEKRIERVLSEMQGIANRKARFVCVIAIAFNGEVIETFEGVVNGHISDRPRGSNGFGYDPIFVPEGYDESFAEMSEEAKNQISHRSEAYRKAVEFIEDEMSILDDEF